MTLPDTVAHVGLLVRHFETRYGLVLSSHIVSGLAAVLERRVRATGADPRDYVNRVLGGSLPDEHHELLCAVTVPETYFFRHRSQLDHLVAAVPPGAQSWRVWSAGCCTGEEPASIAMLLHTARPEVAATIIATDANPTYLSRARQRLYREWSFRACPDGLRERFFSPAGNEGFELRETVASRVDYQLHNLVVDLVPDPARGLASLDAIVCRNVLMYFAPATRRRVVERLVESLRPGGLLVLGHAEWQAAQGVAGLESVDSAEACLRRSGGGASQAVWPVQTSARPEPDPPAVRAETAGAAVTDWKPHCFEPLILPAGRSPGAPQGPDAARDDAIACARRAADSGDYATAAEYCTQAVRTDPLDSDAWFVAALVAEAAGDPIAAEDALRRTLYLDPDHLGAAFRVALLLSRNLTATAGATGSSAAVAVRAEAARNRLAVLLAGMDGDALVDADANVDVAFVRHWLRPQESFPS